MEDKQKIKDVIEKYLMIVYANVLNKKIADITLKDKKLFTVINDFGNNQEIPEKVYVIWRSELQLGYIHIEGEKIGWMTEVEVRKVLSHKQVMKQAKIIDQQHKLK